MRVCYSYKVLLFLLVFKFATSKDESWHPKRQLLKINYNPEGEILVHSFWQVHNTYDPTIVKSSFSIYARALI